MNQRIKNINAIFHPKSIAFIGATENRGKWGNIVFANILKGEWKGKLYPVNPGSGTILDIKAYPSVKDIPGEVDLAIFTIPAKFVPAAIDECVEKGVKAGVIISAGFKETGAEGAALEKEIIEKARRGGMVLAGPNGQGICCTNSGLYPWLPSFYPRPGTVGVVSQSGNIMSLMIGSVDDAGLGTSKGVSSGNEADLKAVDYFEYFADDPEVDVIMAYLEGLTDARDFFQRTKAVALKKPVIILKGARSSSGAAAASSHTGAMAVSDALFESACRQAGIILARTIEEAGTLAASFVNRPLPRGNKIGILTGGGGLGVLASDACSAEGLELAKFSEKFLNQISGLLPSWWVPGNPIDTVAGMNPGIFKPLIEAVTTCGEFDAFLLIMVGAPTTKKGVRVPEKAQGAGTHRLNPLVESFKEITMNFGKVGKTHNVPIYPVIDFPEFMSESFSIYQGDCPIAFYKNVELACRVIGEMYRYNLFLEKNEQIRLKMAV